MSKPALATICCLLVIPAPAFAGTGEVPSDRQPLELPPAPPEEGGAILLPRAPEAGAELDAGQTAWSQADPALDRRDEHLALTAAAFGAGGAFAGLGVSFLLASAGQLDPGARRGWQGATLVAGGLSALGLVTGTVLWLTAPAAPVAVGVIPGPGGFQLAVRF